MKHAIPTAFLAVVLLAGAAAAQEQALLCCGTKTCPEGTAANEERTACCTDPDDPSTCEETANLGKRCNDDLAAALTGTPARGNLAGCVEVPGACIGGQIGDDSGPVAGCVCLGDVCEADIDFPDGKPNCTRIAVDACCDAGACL